MLDQNDLIYSVQSLPNLVFKLAIDDPVSPSRALSYPYTHIPIRSHTYTSSWSQKYDFINNLILFIGSKSARQLFLLILRALSIYIMREYIYC